MIRLFQHVFGLDNASGGWYLAWSGIGSDLTEFALVGALWHAFNCHQPGCRRIGAHHIDGLRVCRRHHPGATTAPASTEETT